LIKKQETCFITSFLALIYLLGNIFPTLIPTEYDTQSLNLTFKSFILLVAQGHSNSHFEIRNV